MYYDINFFRVKVLAIPMIRKTISDLQTKELGDSLTNNGPFLGSHYCDEMHKTGYADIRFTDPLSFSILVMKIKSSCNWVFYRHWKSFLFVLHMIVSIK